MATIDHVNVSDGATITYTCKHGSVFNHGHIHMHAFCDDGVWRNLNETQTLYNMECVSKLLRILSV